MGASGTARVYGLRGRAPGETRKVLRDDWRRPDGFADAFAAAYRTAGGTLPPDWRSLTRLIDLLNLVQLLESPESRRTEDVRRLVAETLSEI